ncbi:cobalt-precorrin-5B (C(1))-methyltransferase CbiD [Mastigocoleus testarum]|uniref:Cobalt-precorrin-5B C(1)-methyltransferase n=1 Tax=Mastigocoleus testarum BC008 TaxID=371196 RepID=A0A0V7ZDK4_9CYAN|nr:cobalt-precorrin-5B (C(1))-methyltransferase CbiD [Mastigocoleus testarum]KST62547.1 cobalt-precorrin-6A synthase [Mastigocoleus testarum BC008]KST62585.1 cobalt-precorrin-6A synthase [Mastigocoleus testarum BC008]
MPRQGYTLPVFAVAAAKAALLHLQNNIITHNTVNLDLLPEAADIPIQQVANLANDTALAITNSDPGDNLDITKNTPIWAWVKLLPRENRAEEFILEAGEGLGKTVDGEAAIYHFARRLFEVNVSPLISPDRTAIIRIILPEGRQLAQRTSNEAFGILEGLALLGTSGISQPLSAADHLEEFRAVLREKVKNCSDLVFCIGNNGFSVAQRLPIPESAIIPTGNWLGALLVEAGLYKAKSVTLLGYQGKLIKLAGGIFNTSSHIADAKLEIIAAAVVEAGGDIQIVQTVLQAKTADAAYKTLVGVQLADRVFALLAARIGDRAKKYVQKYASVELDIKVILFDRQGNIIHNLSEF